MKNKIKSFKKIIKNYIKNKTTSCKLKKKNYKKS